MPLSWNEIRHRAIAFSKDWKGETREAAERQSFWNEFFNVFGVRRRTVATFEEPVKKLTGDWGFIDLFWPGRVLVEHKSAGEDLGKAHSQGMAYIRGLKDTGRDREIPRWLIVSDFTKIALHDLEPEQDPGTPLFKRLPPTIEFPIAELHKHVRHFAFIAGYTHHRLNPEDPANLEATQLMCNVHDALEAGGYTGHELKRFLVRILFCLFADDNGIFPAKAFELFLRDRTAPDGSDLGIRLAQLFEILNTDTPQRQRNLDEELSQFPYVNGELFAERLKFADFTTDMRNGLLACCAFRWETISPAVFGSLFQAVMDSKERRQVGAHYTAEKNILKLIRSLFLDELRAEFETIKTDRSTRRTARLQEFQDKLSKLRFFDPACGCGNFLVLTYRELRKLELEVLSELHGKQHELSLDAINQLSKINVNQFYGIEIEEFPARIAEVALWLTDHQANIALSQAFGQMYQRLPLRASPHIHVNNALRMDWRKVILPDECSYILGNPPFVGKQFMTADQNEDMNIVCGKLKGSGLLDYVTGWYFKAGGYIQGSTIVAAFVSTNSITQGEQAGILWGSMFQQYHVKICFGHRTFAWESEARGKAHVHVVIVGFAVVNRPDKRIYDYETENATVSTARNISPYLVEGGDLAISSRTKPICPVPEISFGSMPNDGGHLLLTDAEKVQLLQIEPGAENFVRRCVGSDEFIKGTNRWCLWLTDASPAELRTLPEVMKRIDNVRELRLKSPRETTQKLAKTPALFGEIRQPQHRYLAVPKTSSERRAYVPMAFLEATTIASSEVFTIQDARLYEFGILTSQMHMAWVRQVCGRLKSDYRYSAKLVYNNYPWPAPVTDKQRAAVEAAAQAVLAARAQYMECGGLPPLSPPDATSRTKPQQAASRQSAGKPAHSKSATLADLYDPLTMPAPLLKAHQALDRAVDRCYRPEPFESDRHRVEYLFALYEKITAPLVAAAKQKSTRRQRKEPLLRADRKANT